MRPLIYLVLAIIISSAVVTTVNAEDVYFTLNRMVSVPIIVNQNFFELLPPYMQIKSDLQVYFAKGTFEVKNDNRSLLRDTITMLALTMDMYAPIGINMTRKDDYWAIMRCYVQGETAANWLRQNGWPIWDAKFDYREEIGWAKILMYNDYVDTLIALQVNIEAIASSESTRRNISWMAYGSEYIQAIETTEGGTINKINESQNIFFSYPNEPLLKTLSKDHAFTLCRGNCAEFSSQWDIRGPANKYNTNLTVSRLGMLGNPAEIWLNDINVDKMPIDNQFMIDFDLYLEPASTEMDSFKWNSTEVRISIPETGEVVNEKIAVNQMLHTPAWTQATFPEWIIADPLYISTGRHLGELSLVITGIRYQNGNAQTITTDPLFIKNVQIVGVNDTIDVDDLLLVSASPNPFKSQVRFFNTNAVTIFDLNGKLVQRLQTKENQVIWDGTDFQARNVPSGVYIAVTDYQQQLKIIKVDR